MDLRTELKKIISSVEPESIWRSVYDNDDTLVAMGQGDPCEGRPEDLSRVDFRGKSVLDVGCNFGFHSFLVSRLGAGDVVGVDIDEPAIRACAILKAMYGVNAVRFITGDFTQVDLPDKFDIGLLINFFGKVMISEGIQKFLRVLEGLSRQQMIISARPYYFISKHFNGRTQTLLSHYPERYLDQDRFLLQDFLQDFFRDNWDMSLLSPAYPDEGVRRTLLFTRI